MIDKHIPVTDVVYWTAVFLICTKSGMSLIQASKAVINPGK